MKYPLLLGLIAVLSACSTISDSKDIPHEEIISSPDQPDIVVFQPEPIDEWEINKEEIIRDFYFPYTLDDVIYVYKEKLIDKESTEFYILYRSLNGDGPRKVEINDFDKNGELVGLKVLEILNDKVNVLEYVLVDPKRGELLATIELDSDYLFTCDIAGIRYASMIESIVPISYLHVGVETEAYEVTYLESFDHATSSTVVTYAKDIGEVKMIYFAESGVQIGTRTLVDVISIQDFEQFEIE